MVSSNLTVFANFVQPNIIKCEKLMKDGSHYCVEHYDLKLFKEYPNQYKDNAEKKALLLLIIDKVTIDRTRSVDSI